MNRKYILAIAFGIIFIGLITLIVRNVAVAPKISSGKPQVVTSFYPLYFFTSQIAGDKANVSNITPAGAEPHDYEPTPQDIVKIENSKLVILNGGGLEAWGDKIKSSVDPKQTIIVTAGEGLTTQQVTEDGHTMTDPHVWLSPVLAEQMADKIEAGLAQVDPSNAEYYRSNLQTLKSKLVMLDSEYKQGLISCAEKNIITSHAAFGYLATEYHLNQVPIAGLSPDAEPSPKQLADIASFAKTNNVKYIFFESLASPKLSQTIATEIGAKTLVLDPIEGLTAEQIASGTDYFTLMRNNLANLRLVLQCK